MGLIKTKFDQNALFKQLKVLYAFGLGQYIVLQ